MMETSFNRNGFLRKLDEVPQWDVLVIGGGATGLGIALDAASRGYATLLLEGSDFAKGTSSRSTKLVHGGVRYLAQGDIRLVYDALHERGLLLRNAAHLVKKQAFIIPCYSLFSKMKYLAGLKIYDWLSGRLSFGSSQVLSGEEVREQLPGISPEGLVGGIKYFDGQFDDARLAVNLAQTCAEKGGVVLNYVTVSGLLKQEGKISGVTALDKETGRTYELKSKVVVNATGVFVDAVLSMDQPGRPPLVRSSQGVHLVLPPSFLQGSSALMIPETEDGRVLFAVPWNGYLLAGTTDTPLDQHSLEPVALDKEIRFILQTLRQYLTRPPEEGDVCSVFAGLRPLAVPKKQKESTKEISRDHKLLVSPSGLITITGGKWTTYRKMAMETVDKVIEVGGLEPVPCGTESIPIHGCMDAAGSDFTQYGSDAARLRKWIDDDPGLGRPLTPGLSYTEAEVVWAVRHEMARTVEDVLARRLRLLFQDARAAIAAAPAVARLMRHELRYDASWEEEQVALFSKLALQYLPPERAAAAPAGRLHDPLEEMRG